MASENAVLGDRQTPDSASENTTPASPTRRGRQALHLSAPHAAILGDYTAALKAAPLSAQTRRTYASKVRQYLAWLVAADADGDPLNERDARDWAVRDYRTHLQAVLKRKPATVNSALAAIDDLYLRRGLGPANAARADLPSHAPRALDTKAATRFLRAVDASPSSRDRVTALLPFYAGARIAEVVGLDVDDVQLSARKGIVRIYGKGAKVREVPVHPQLREALTAWLTDRAGWPGAESSALLLNRRGGRLGVKGAHDIITGLAATAGLEDDATTHVLRHTFATRLVRGGTDLVVVAELLGHARLETTRGYTRPTHEDAVRALELLDVDR